MKARNREENAGYERSDARPGPLLVFAGGLTALVVVSLLVCAWIQTSLLHSLGERDAPHPLAELREGAIAPVLQANPVTEIEAVRAEEDRLLNEYAWIDRPNEVVRIPIELAIQLIAEEGLPYARSNVQEEER